MGRSRNEGPFLGDLLLRDLKGDLNLENYHHGKKDIGDLTKASGSGLLQYGLRSPHNSRATETHDGGRPSCES